MLIIIIGLLFGYLLGTVSIYYISRKEYDWVVEIVKDYLGDDGFKDFIKWLDKND